MAQGGGLFVPGSVCPHCGHVEPQGEGPALKILADGYDDDIRGPTHSFDRLKAIDAAKWHLNNGSAPDPDDYDYHDVRWGIRQLERQNYIPVNPDQGTIPEPHEDPIGLEPEPYNTTPASPSEPIIPPITPIDRDIII
jgi:hypothetical protein